MAYEDAIIVTLVRALEARDAQQRRDTLMSDRPDTTVGHSCFGPAVRDVPARPERSPRGERRNTLMRRLFCR